MPNIIVKAPVVEKDKKSVKKAIEIIVRDLKKKTQKS
jgi:hypothetical protein